jgi:hypothetical protein
LQLDAVHAPHVVAPAAQLCVPVPFATVQLCEPDGLLHACEVTAVPHAAASVGVQLCEVTAVPVQLAVPTGVQLCDAAGFTAAQKASATTAPRLSQHLTVRVCVPVFAFQLQLEVRVCEPLLAVKPHDAERVCVPVPPHTAVTEQALHEP